MFSIVGVSFFAGKFQYCTADKYENHTEAQCTANGGAWKTYYDNFDNVINGLIYLFSLATQVNWADSVYQAIDCTKVNKGPEIDKSWYFSLYHVVFIFIGCMFLMNIFLGILFYNFKKAYKNELGSLKGILLTDEQIDWIEIQKLIVRAKPDYKTRTAPNKARWRTAIHKFVTNLYFEWFIAFLLVGEMVMFAVISDTMAEEHRVIMSVIENVTVAIFALEAALKIIAFGRNYWYESWNVFELVVILLSFASTILEEVANDSHATFVKITQLLRIVRVLRVARIFSLLSHFQRFHTVIEIIQICLPSIINIFGFMLFIIFIYAILGCYLFYEVPYGMGINEVYNFKNFLRALIVCLKMSTGEDWNLIMHDCAQHDVDCSPGLMCGKWYAFVYFLSFRIVVGFVIINLYSLIVLHFFDKYFVPESSAIRLFKEDYDLFRNKWLAVQPSYWGHFVHVYKLPRFFRSLPDAFNFEKDDPNILCKEITSLRIRW
eukprot:TRINITY_DN15859_c0_g1_i8.p1 TRINITY_DN15859_c0_g1~~TRINITY_DN15859_c0_g1_i8.p1  ORF type:complete len:490 (+),score=118.20 TRINITY_DN15859_c0_g1_i8:999-2468(+)